MEQGFVLCAECSHRSSRHWASAFCNEPGCRCNAFVASREIDRGDGKVALAEIPLLGAEVRG